MEQVERYLKQEAGYGGAALVEELGGFLRNVDIAEEFAHWIETGEFGGLEVEGYSAAKIAELASFMDGLGVYNFLISLREEPEEAKGYIAEGFPRY